jgi:hypothetical protein
MVDLLLAAILATSSGGCVGQAIVSGECVDGSVSDSGAVLEGHTRGDSGDTTIDGDGGDEAASAPDETFYCGRRTDDRCSFEFTITPPGAVSMSDVAAFPVQPGGLISEPNGWAVLGLTANLVSGAAEHTVEGTLLSRPAAVRFTPVSWSWDYGDDTTARTSTGGGTWAALGRNEFDPTPTGHIYTTRGTYRVRADVTFTAAYRFDGGTWIPIPGTLTVPATDELSFRAVAARTALVTNDCRARPTGPGC